MAKLDISGSFIDVVMPSKEFVAEAQGGYSTEAQGGCSHREPDEPLPPPVGFVGIQSAMPQHWAFAREDAWLATPTGTLDRIILHDKMPSMLHRHEQVIFGGVLGAYYSSFHHLKPLGAHVARYDS
eukprot:782474-Amphidinium_carterae.2